MGDNYWEATIAALQDASNPLVDKPKLSEKYLTKPPFRFLHDVITAVQNKTGFAPGLFQGDELDGKALQDKDAKVTYLTKIIDVVSMVLGETVPAKPLKIVAGLEPENTNTFLQMLGRAAQKGDAAAVVQRVLGGEQPGAAPAAAPAAAAEKPKARPKPKPKPAAEPAAEEAAPAPAEAPAEKPVEKPAEKKKVAKPKAAPPPEDAAPAPPPAPEEPEKKEKKRSSTSGSKAKAAKEEDAPLPAPAAPAADVEASAGSASAAAQRSLARPQSARKAPPKLPTQTPPPAPSPAAAAAAAPAAARPGTATRRGPDAAAAKPVMLFEEGAKGGDDDDDVEVVHEQRPVAIGAMPEGEQGVLVKNILEAEKALKKTREEGEDEGQGSGIILKRLGKPAAAAGAVKTSDHAGMREMVQKLTQSSHPLAKSMDYLQEDLENMAKEYRFWVTERRVFQEKLGDEQRMVSDQAAADARLADLEGQVRQVRDRTLGLKAQILRNDETIAKLLTMAVSGGR